MIFTVGKVLSKNKVRLVEEKQRVLIPIEFLAEAEKTLSGKKHQNQRHALQTLWKLKWVESAAALSRKANVPVTAVRTLVKKGYASYEDKPAPAPSLPHYVAGIAPSIELTLTDRENLSLSGGLRAERLASLVPLLKEDIAMDRSVLVLLPESAFLAETAAAFVETLPTKVFSGDLNDRQRLRVWQELAETPTVLVGTYLALLAPFI